jgi:phosphotriesterase-related protein
MVAIMQNETGRAGKTVMTALGPIAPEELGFTSMHEHVMFQGAVLARRMREMIPAGHGLPIDADDKVSLENVGLLLNNSIMAWDALVQDDEDVMAGEVQDFKDAGGGAIVEVSVPGIQLATAPMRNISRRTGVHIVVSTGFYTWDSWPEEFRGLGVREYKRHMEGEIRHGVQGTDIRPGSLKIALEDLNEMEENALRAAAQLCGETGLPLTIHPCLKPGADQIQVIRILREEGVDLGRVVFAHTPVVSRPGLFRDLIDNPGLVKVTTELALRIMDEGANCSIEFENPLGFEMMGRYNLGDLWKTSGICKIIEAGYSGQLVLGNDCCGRTMLRRGGALGYLRLMGYGLTTLRDVAGVPESAIRRITVENPARILAH